MKIIIKEDCRQIVIRIPNFILTTPIGKKWLKRKYNLDFELNQLKQIGKDLHKFKKNCNLPIVEVKSKNCEVTVQW